MLRSAVTFLLLPVALASADQSPVFLPEQIEFFEKQVRPLLVERCHKCHSASEQKGNLRLDSRDAVLRGGDTGPAVNLIQPDASELLRAIRYEPDGYQMPPDGKLRESEIAILTRWIAEGAPWPSESRSGPNTPHSALDPQPSTLDLSGAEFARRMQHWSFQPLARPSLPVADDPGWCRNPIDRFVAAKRQAAGLPHAAETDRTTWLRRASFDLLGLPPSPEVVEAFVHDDAPDSHEQVIDRWLASPHFGERWGRHWLDLVRYAESRGHEFDYDVANPWPYRDYVIRAINGDVPYDRFVVEHVAGDLLSVECPVSGVERQSAESTDRLWTLDTGHSTPNSPRLDPATGANESIVATGFWFLGEWVHSPVDIRQDEADRFENMIDVCSKTFLGLTVACACCHDHKFDPIPQTDYYALQGYLQSSSYRQAPFETLEHNRRIAAALRALRREASPVILATMRDVARPVTERLDRYLLAARRVIESNAVDVTAATSAQGARLDPEILRRWAAYLKTVPADDAASPFWRAFASPAPLDLEVLTRENNSRRELFVGSTESVLSHRRNHPDDDYFTAVEMFGEGAGFVGGAEVGADDLALLSNDPAAPLRAMLSRDRLEWDPDWPEPAAATGAAEPGARGKLGTGGRVVRTPSFEIAADKIYCRVYGGVHSYVAVDSHLLIHGPLHGSLVKAHPAEPRWRLIEHDVSRYKGHRAHLELIAAAGQPFGVAEVFQASAPPDAGPTPWLPGDLLSEAALAKRMAEQVGPQWFIDYPELFNLDSTPARDRLTHTATPYLRRYRELYAQIRSTSHLAPVMLDGRGADEYLFIRGNWKKRGETVPRRFLSAFGGVQGPASRVQSHPAETTNSVLLDTQHSTLNSPALDPRLAALDSRNGSGRLQLATQMVDPRQTPIVARVIVNRIWQHYFGRGIVPTPDDFGHLGLPPSHPELLDWLASELVEHNWSLKHIHRLILTSATYRMASDGVAIPPITATNGIKRSAAEPSTLNDPLTVDPDNTLLWRMNVIRLEGEVIRDALLSVSGRLDDELYGPSVPVHLTPFMEGRGRPEVSGPVDGRGRRSLYLAVRRNFPDPFLQAFDFPNPHTTIGRRNVSNVPAQALALLNNPLVLEQSRAAAQRLREAAPHAAPDQRIDWLYRHAFGRRPTDAEQLAGQEFLSKRVDSPDGPSDTTDVWADYVHVLINTKEFVLIR